MCSSDLEPLHPLDIWPTLAVAKPSLTVRKGKWKLRKVALLPAKTELFDPGHDLEDGGLPQERPLLPPTSASVRSSTQ